MTPETNRLDRSLTQEPSRRKVTVPGLTKRAFSGTICPTTSLEYVADISQYSDQMPTQTQQIANALALKAMRLLARLKHALVGAASTLAPLAAAAWFVMARFIVFPVYKLFMTVRMRLNRMLLSARELVFLVMTNRYVFHTVLLALSVVAVGSQLQTKHATAIEAGQNSLLYTFVTGGQDAYVEEEVHPESLVKDSRYLGAETFAAVSGIDYDFEPYESTMVADAGLPGTIAYQPGADEPGTLAGSIRRNRTKTEFYTVADGDTISTIAAGFGVNVPTVLWANNLSSRSTIRPGQSLKIPAVSGVLHIVKKNDTLAAIAKRYGGSVEQIQEANRMAPDTVLALGEEIVVPGGTPPVIASPVAVRPRGNVRPDVPLSRIRNKVYDVYQEVTGSNDTRDKPADLVEAEPTTKLLWPTVHKTINQYFGWRHTGLDIHGRYTDAIYASQDGVVEKAGWNSGGYGLQILVNHGGNVKTRYAHASKLFVKAGDEVKRGEVIAMVGTTGRSTGPHLHFEVIVSGKVKNPLAYTR